MKTCAIIVTGGLLMLLAATAPAFPQTVADPIDQRRENQEARIAAGVRDGSLTPDEEGDCRDSRPAFPGISNAGSGGPSRFHRNIPAPSIV